MGGLPLASLGSLTTWPAASTLGMRVTLRVPPASILALGMPNSSSGMVAPASILIDADSPTLSRLVSRGPSFPTPLSW
ncbi:hypothetical protein D3C86_1697990 [compost metagenome]